MLKLAHVTMPEISSAQNGELSVSGLQTLIETGPSTQLITGTESLEIPIQTKVSVEFIL